MIYRLLRLSIFIAGFLCYTLSLSQTVISVSEGELSLHDDPYLYDGAYQAAENKLMYLIARNYDPEASRFISQDSYKLFNRYSSFGEDPVRYVDPNGHHKELVKRIMNNVNKGLNFTQHLIESVAGGVVVAKWLFVGGVGFSGGVSALLFFSSGFTRLTHNFMTMSKSHASYSKSYHNIRIQGLMNVFMLPLVVAMGFIEATSPMTAERELGIWDQAKYPFASAFSSAVFNGGAIFGTRKVKTKTGINTSGEMHFVSNGLTLSFSALFYKSFKNKFPLPKKDFTNAPPDILFDA
ncbi:hypothetical protein IB691_09975 [Fangia hongkongensis]|nr:hypothetical protein [Fangia hongkongensis]